MFSTLWALTLVSAQSVNNDCVFDPSQTQCFDYLLDIDKVLFALQQNCREQPFSMACSFFEFASRKVDISPSSPLSRFSPFQHLTNACLDFPRTDLTCKTYIQMCRPGSVIQQCEMDPIIPTNRDLAAICKLFPNECKSCAKHVQGKLFLLPSKISHSGGQTDANNSGQTCSPIRVFSDICTKHSHINRELLPECDTWKELCTRLNYNESGLCPSLGPKMPVHRPFFHFNGPEFILIRSWVTNSYLSSLIAMIVSFSLGLVLEIQGGTRKRLQAGAYTLSYFPVWALEDKRADRGDGTGEEGEEERDPLLPRRLSRMTFQRVMLRGQIIAISIKRRSIRSFLRLLEMSFLVCMLAIASSFNVVYIFCMAGGLVVGCFFAGTSDIELLELSDEGI